MTIQRNESILKTIRTTTQNTRVLITTELMWSIPYFNYIPFMALYMKSFGVTDGQIGLLATVAMIMQMITVTFAGAIVDKLGRRRSIFYLNMISWGVPFVIYFFANSFVWFLIATIIGTLPRRISAIAWSSMMVEDAEKRHIVNIWASIQVCDYIAGLMVPIGAILVRTYDLVPTMKGLFLFSFVSMVTKFIYTYIKTTETSVGKLRMEQTKGSSMLGLMKGYGPIIKGVFRNKRLLVGLVMQIVLMIYVMVKDSFWAIRVTEALGFPIWFASVSVFVLSGVALIIYTFVMPKIDSLQVKRPLLVGMLFILASLIIFLCAGNNSYVLVILSIILDGIGLAIFKPFSSTLMTRAVDRNERARVLSVTNTIMLGISAPFGIISGLLSQQSKNLPFLLMMFFLVIPIITLIFIKADWLDVDEV